MVMASKRIQEVMLMNPPTSGGLASTMSASELPAAMFESLVSAWAAVLVSDYRRRHAIESGSSRVLPSAAVMLSPSTGPSA